MLTQKLIAAAGLATALLFGATTDASAQAWGRPGPVYRGVDYRFHHGPFYGGPVGRGIDYRFHHGPFYGGPVYAPPVVRPVYGGPVYAPPVVAPAYAAPVYAPPVVAPAYGVSVYAPVVRAPFFYRPAFRGHFWGRRW
jgi:hypothetical protein